MRIINVSDSDWANFSYENCQAMKSVGLRAESYKLIPHHFGYKNESEVVSKKEMERQIQYADIIQIMHSNTGLLQLCNKHNKKRLYVYHTGTTYRRDPVKINKAFNPYILRAFTDETEFMGTGMLREFYFTSPVNCNEIKAEIKLSPTLTFAHYPSFTQIKVT